MHGRGVQSPPASNPQGFPDGRNVRHGCGFAYNGYAWSGCPKCEADERRMFATRCVGCRNTFFAAEREDLCPECGSGNTAVVAAPENPAVR